MIDSVEECAKGEMADGEHAEYAASQNIDLG